MRISVDEADPGHANYQRVAADWPGHKPVVRLNGEIVARVVTADEERGLIVRHEADAFGRLVLDYTRADVKREELKGIVRIVWEKPADAPTSEASPAAWPMYT